MPRSKVSMRHQGKLGRTVIGDDGSDPSFEGRAPGNDNDFHKQQPRREGLVKRWKLKETHEEDANSVSRGPLVRASSGHCRLIES